MHENLNASVVFISNLNIKIVAVADIFDVYGPVRPVRNFSKFLVFGLFGVRLFAQNELFVVRTVWAVRQFMKILLFGVFGGPCHTIPKNRKSSCA